MKKRGSFVLLVFILLILFAISISSSSAEIVKNVDFAAKDMLIDFNLATVLSIKPTDTNYMLNNVTTELYFFPRNDYRQKNQEINLNGGKIINGEEIIKGKEIINGGKIINGEEILNGKKILNGEKIKDSRVVYKWLEPSEDKLRIGINSRIKTTNIAKEITKKIDFPLRDLPEEVMPYLEENELMNINDPSIVELATTLAEGEDDLYIVVFKIASWVRDNVEYSLDTLTADASLSASWVLKNRRGVCDEMTNLFISLVRTLGIPAKFVSGISYTESELFNEKWGPHGWAEVYMPNYGWVPFDVTYGQLGNIDPTHIKLKETSTSDKTSTSFEWTGNNVNIESSGLKFDVNVLEEGEKIRDTVKIANSLLRPEIGFGSYNLLITKIKNNQNYYLPINLMISKTPSLEVINDKMQHVLLKPFEEKNVFWRLKVSNALEPQNIYTFSILTYTPYDENDTILLKSFYNAPKLSYDDIKMQEELLAQGKEKVYSAKVSFECMPERYEYYLEEEVKVKCELKNQGNKNLGKINVCLRQECKMADVKIAQQRQVAFNLGKLKKDNYELYAVAKNDDISKSSKINFNVQEIPMLEIGNDYIPSEVRFDQKFDIKFTIFKTESVANNVSVTLFFDHTSEQWVIDKFLEDRDFIINVGRYELASTKNNLRILVEYYDCLNRKYSLEKKYVISIPQVTFKDRSILLFNRINSDPKFAATIVSIFVLLIIVLVILKKVLKKKEK